MACFTANCKTRMHMHCFAVHRRHHATCPQCAQQWPQQVVAPLLPVGEGAAKDGVADERRRIRKKSPEGEDSDAGSEPEDNDVPMDEDEPSQPSQAPTKAKTQASQRTQTRKSSRAKAEKGKGKK
jgi:non-structural maintenance of chromosomes element 1